MVCTTGAWRVSARRAPVDEVMRVLELFETRYPETAKHFHEKLVCEHGDRASYNWLRAELAGARQDQAGAQARAPPEAAAPTGVGMNQDGSSHEWVAGQWWDLIVTMDDATSEVYSGFFVAEEGTKSHVPRARRGERRKRAAARSTPIGPRTLAHAEAGRCGQGQPDPGRPGLGAARHRVDRGLFAAGPGPLGAHVRDLAEAPGPGAATSPGSPPWPRPIAFRGALLAGAQRPLRPPGRGHRLGLQWLLPHASRTSSDAQEGRVVTGDNTVRYKNRTLQIPADRHRHHGQGAGPGARISRRPPGRLPRTQVSGALPRRRETSDDDRLQAA